MSSSAFSAATRATSAALSWLTAGRGGRSRRSIRGGSSARAAPASKATTTGHLGKRPPQGRVLGRRVELAEDEGDVVVGRLAAREDAHRAQDVVLEGGQAGAPRAHLA